MAPGHLLETFWLVAVLRTRNDDNSTTDDYSGFDYFSPLFRNYYLFKCINYIYLNAYYLIICRNVFILIINYSWSRIT